MRSPLIQRQTVEYNENESFCLNKVEKRGVNHTYQKSSHWHEDLEIIYIFQGKATIFVDGEYIYAEPGQLVVINCESVHRVSIETKVSDEYSDIAAMSLMIPQKFLDEQFPEYKTMRFINKNTQASQSIQSIFMQFSKYDHSTSRPYDRLYMHGLLLQLLYYMCEQGFVIKTDDYSQHKSLIRLKSILQYIDEHYQEPLTQSDIATRFYFTPQYFSRYFKQCTGMTFSEHLTGRRIHSARQELLHTDKLVAEIAFSNGFSDERSFINAFKKMYQITPHQYRKNLILSLK